MRTIYTADTHEPIYVPEMVTLPAALDEPTDPRGSKPGLCKRCKRHRPLLLRRLRLCHSCAGIVRHEQRMRAAECDREEPMTAGCTLPCLACKVPVKVTDAHRDHAIRIKCPWTVCDSCEESAEEFR